MSTAEKLKTIAENEQKVYDAGYSKAESDFWDKIQDYGNRTNYQYAFWNLGCEYIRPKYKVVIDGSANSTATIGLFAYSKKLKKVEAEYFDLSNGKYDATGTGSCGNRTFDGCTSLEEIEDIGLQAGYYYYTFNDCTNLKRIAILRTNAQCMYGNTFNGCNNLEEIDQIEGEIGNNMYLQTCYSLSHDTLIRILNALKDYSTSARTSYLTIGATNLEKLTDTEKAIATQKGWTLS